MKSNQNKTERMTNMCHCHLLTIFLNFKKNLGIFHPGDALFQCVGLHCALLHASVFVILSNKKQNHPLCMTLGTSH